MYNWYPCSNPDLQFLWNERLQIGLSDVWKSWWKSNKEKLNGHRQTQQKTIGLSSLLGVMDSQFPGSCNYFVPKPQQLLRFHEAVMIIQSLPVWERRNDGRRGQGLQVYGVDVYGLK